MPLQLRRQPFVRLALPLFRFVSLADVEVPLKQKMTLSDYPCKRIRDPKSLRGAFVSDIKGNLHVVLLFTFFLFRCKTSHLYLPINYICSRRASPEEQANCLKRTGGLQSEVVDAFRARTRRKDWGVFVSVDIQTKQKLTKSS